MKAERRHELQQNSLAKFIEDLPLYFRFHLNKILLGLLIVLAVVFLVRYRMTSAAHSKALAQSSLRDARDGIDQLRVLDFRSVLPQDIANMRRSVSSQVSAALEAVLRDTEDPADARTRAEALVTRGDLYWTLANLPALPGATTQQALQPPQTSAEALQSAEDAWQQVLQKHSDQMMPAVTAMFGLAAIAENRAQWDIAKAQYSAILQRADAPQSFKTAAALRLQALVRLSEPLFTGTLTTQPATSPATPTATSPAN